MDYFLARHSAFKRLTTEELFGMIAVMDKKAYPVSAVPLKPTEAYRIPAGAFENLLRKHPDLSREVYAGVGDRRAGRLHPGNRHPHLDRTEEKEVQRLRLETDHRPRVSTPESPFPTRIIITGILPKSCAGAYFPFAPPVILSATTTPIELSGGI